MDNNDSIRGRLKSDLSSKGWWYGAIGGVLSTVIGIALTFGVSAWISYRSDKQQAREMMFNVVRMEKANGDAVAEYDTLFASHLKAAIQLVDIYRRTIDMEDLDSLTTDSVMKLIRAVCTYKEIPVPYVGMDKYFYNAENMHQFGNSVAYSYFCSAVHFDQQTYEDIRKLREMWYEFSDSLNYKIQVSAKVYSIKQVLNEMIEDHSLTNYADHIRNENLPWRVSFYRSYYIGLLKVMGATEDDYKEYLKSLKASDEKRATKYSKLKTEGYK